MHDAVIINGKLIAEKIISKIKAETGKISVKPGIAVIIVGEDPASKVYVRSKNRKAIDCGFYSTTHTLKQDISKEKLIELIKKLNEDNDIHGILVQLPLPEHIDSRDIIQAIDPRKDVDGFNFLNVGKLGTGAIDSAFIPCTPAGSMVLIHSVLGKSLDGLNALVIGRSNIVGKPLANLLLAQNCTVTIAHSRTRNLPELAAQADILIAATGRPEMVRGEWIKPGACVVDVGINQIESTENKQSKSRLVGDVAYDECVQVAGSITPVPGGVGPMTIAMLMANTLISACRANNLKSPIDLFS